MVANEILEKLLSWTNQILPQSTDEPLSPFQKPARVLIIPSLFIGDTILMTPFLRNLRQGLGPQVRIDMVSRPATHPLLETLPWLDHVYAEKVLKRQHKTFLETQGYDTLFFGRYSLTWGHAARRAKISQRIGFDLARLGIRGLKAWGRCLTHSIPSTSLIDPRPQVEIYLDILRHLNLPVHETHLECRLLPDDHQQAQTLLQNSSWQASSSRPRFVIHAASGSPGKQWPSLYWRQVLEQLQADYDPIWIATGTAAEAKLYQPWEGETPLLNLCGQTSLRETIAVLQQVDLVITLDTALAHLAALAGTPRLVVLYGPTNHNQWRPWIQAGTQLRQVFLELPCRPCPARTCNHKCCLQDLAPERVIAAVYSCMQASPL